MTVSLLLTVGLLLAVSLLLAVGLLGMFLAGGEVGVYGIAHELLQMGCVDRIRLSS